MKKWWLKLILVVAAVVLVLLIWLATANIHSKSAVERYKDQLRAAGENLDGKELAPGRVDPNKNGLEFYTQAFRLLPSALTDIIPSNAPASMKWIAPGKAMAVWQQPEILWDSRGWPCSNTWENLALDLRAKSPAMDLIRQAAERPQLDFELDFRQGEGTRLWQLTYMRGASLLFAASVPADLHRGDAASATTNLHTLLLMINQWKVEPLDFSQLSRIAMASAAVNAQWDLLQATNVTDEELALLQRDWTNAEFVQPMEQALLMRRDWVTVTIPQLRTSNSLSSFYVSLYPGTSPSSGASLDKIKDLRVAMKRRTSHTLWRVSWSYDDELSALKGDQVLVETARQIRTNGYFKDALANRDRRLAALGINGPNPNWLRNQVDEELMFGVGSARATSRCLDQAMIAEAARAIAGTAVALKRYQLRHQSFPADLSALVPEFLPAVPRDPVDGKPLRYALNPDGTFLLYSVGSDGVDNGGDATTGAYPLQWLRGRDWVWPQPATAQEVDYFRAHPPN